MKPHQLILVAEGRIDQEAVVRLVDRVLYEEGPDWFRDNVEAGTITDSPVTWTGLHGPGFTTWPQLKQLALSHRIRVRRRGEGPAAAEARKALMVFERLAPPEAWLIAHRDAGDLAGGPFAFVETLNAHPRSIAALAAPEIEAWHLCGFEPLDREEQEAVARATASLGFDPTHQPSRLTARSKDPRSAKSVLAALVGQGGASRRTSCLEHPLAALRARDPETGLAAFLDRVRRVLVPAVFGSRRGR